MPQMRKTHPKVVTCPSSYTAAPVSGLLKPSARRCCKSAPVGDLRIIPAVLERSEGIFRGEHMPAEVYFQGFQRISASVPVRFAIAPLEARLTCRRQGRFEDHLEASIPV